MGKKKATNTLFLMALKYSTTCIMFVLFTVASCSSLKLHFFFRSNNLSLRFIYLLPVLLHIGLTPKEMPTSTVLLNLRQFWLVVFTVVQCSAFRKYSLMLLCDEAGQLAQADVPVKRREEVEVEEEQGVR